MSPVKNDRVRVRRSWTYGTKAAVVREYNAAPATRRRELIIQHGLRRGQITRWQHQVAARERRDDRRLRRPEEGMHVEHPDQPPHDNTRIIKLKSGAGTIIVSSALDLFTLGAEDRVFLFKLIDSLNEYESSS